MSMPPENKLPRRTPRQILVDWANTQDHWVRAIVREVISTRKALSEEQLAEIYTLLLAEKDLAAGPAEDVPALVLGVSDANGAEPFRLRGLTGVQGVNALTPKQEIEFNPKLTVVFGENASGKTGYVRILKRLAAVRSAEPILPNVNAASSQNPPQAILTFTVGENQNTLNWTNESGVIPFSSMAIFDSRAVPIHVDEELTYTYTPSDLALFRFTHDGIEAVKTRLELNKNSTQPKGNPFLTRFSRDTTLYAKIEALGAATNVSDLEALSAVSEEDAKGLDTTRERVEALRPQSVEARLQLARNDQDIYGRLYSVAMKLLAWDPVGYENARLKAVEADARFNTATATAFSKEGIPGVLGESWRSFVEAGEHYLTDIQPVATYPSLDDNCLYCRQPLTEAAVLLIQKYRDFISNEFRQSRERAQEELERRRQPILKLDRRAEEDGAKRAAAMGEKAPEALLQALRLSSHVGRLQQELAGGTAVDVELLTAAARTAADALQRAIQHTDALINTLGTQAAEREQSFKEESKKLRELEARLTLKSLLLDIRDFVLRAQWANRAATLLTARFPALLRSLTEASKQASEELLNQDFEAHFETESKALRAPPVRLDFPGRKGAAARRKTLTTAHKLSSILSEGEQKVIALADFLAEVFLRQASTPIIFDDPVTSLDHRRLQYVAARIVELTKRHQVVVFTHDIRLTVALLAAFEKNTSDCNYYDIERTDEAVGVVTRGTHPRWDTPKKLGKKIDSLISEADKATGEIRAALVEKGYNTLRSWCEVAIEQEVLCGVTQRFQANVMMTKLPQIRADRLESTAAVIFEAFENACRITDAHSQPLDTLSTQASLPELKEDWGRAQEALKAYRQ